MVNLDSGFNRKNAELLFDGIWYSELPPIMDINSLVSKVDDLFHTLDEKESKYYQFNEFNRITKYKNIPRSANRHEDGAEPIVFYDYKNNGAWREMQIPNLIYYISFVYNTIAVFDDLFELIYIDEEQKGLIANSNSYLVFDNEFVQRDNYGEIIDSEIKGQFTNSNTKLKASLLFYENKRRYLKMESGYLYYMKLDIESFFPNLYTHFFERMKDYDPYKTLNVEKDYFKFLDTYNMKIGNNQTKGIPAGVFSSHVSSELLLLCIDEDIRKEISGRSIGYIRYVDDMTFFADNEESLYEIKAIVQKILNKYRLRINGNKTEVHLCSRKKEQTDIKEIQSNFEYLRNDIDYEYPFLITDLFVLKKYICDCLEDKRTSQIKSILTILTNQITKSKIQLYDSSCELFNYVWKLIGEDEKLAVHIYKLLDAILSTCNSDNKIKCLEQLKSKSNLIDNRFADSLLQIWHYYVLIRHESSVREEMIQKLADIKVSPLIATMLIKEGKQENKKMFTYIRDTYKSEIGEQSNEWKSSIMFSKWWLPIHHIALIDSHKYDNWMHTSSYPDILSILSD